MFPGGLAASTLPVCWLYFGANGNEIHSKWLMLPYRLSSMYSIVGDYAIRYSML